MSVEEALSAGVVIGHYRILETLGVGGFGITYLAEDLQLNRKVALKEFFPGSYARRQADGSVVAKNDDAQKIFEWALDAFSDEARTLAKFQHPNIVRVNQLLSGVNNTAYIVMELIHGTSLEKVIAKDGLPPPDQTLSIFRQLLDGCQAVHSNGILHRDINPSNIMMQAGHAGEPSRPVLIDFGASRQLSRQHMRGFSAVVTEGYSPIEQYSRNNTQTEATDIYALAGTMHRLLSGNEPPPGPVRGEEPLAAIPRLRAEAFPPQLIPGVLKGFAIKAADRPQSIAEWRKILGPLELASSPGGRGLDRRALLIGSGAVAAAAVVVGATVVALNPDDALSGATRPLKVAWRKEFGLMQDDPVGQIMASPRGAAIAAHRLGEDGVNRMLALLIGDDGQELLKWIDSGPGGRAHAILPAPDGGAFVGGTVGSTAVLARLNPAWREAWRREVGTGAVKAIIATPSGVVIGLEEPGSSGAPLMSLDAKGGLIWSVAIDKGDGESVERMIALENGGFAVLGSGLGRRQTSAGALVESSVWVALLDAEGKLKNRAETTGLGAAFGWAIAEAGGKLYVTGRTTDGREASQPKLLIWALAGDGVELWQRWDYGLDPSSGRSLALADDSTLYLAGWSGSPYQMRFAQIGPKGDLAWDTQVGTPQESIAAFGIAMRGRGDGFAAASAQAAGAASRLVVARMES